MLVGKTSNGFARPGSEMTRTRVGWSAEAAGRLSPAPTYKQDQSPRAGRVTKDRGPRSGFVTVTPTKKKSGRSDAEMETRER